MPTPIYCPICEREPGAHQDWCVIGRLEARIATLELAVESHAKAIRTLDDRTIGSIRFGGN
jgi:hypothetical protein